MWRHYYLPYGQRSYRMFLSLQTSKGQVLPEAWWGYKKFFLVVCFLFCFKCKCETISRVMVCSSIRRHVFYVLATVRNYRLVIFHHSFFITVKREFFFFIYFCLSNISVCIGKRREMLLFQLHLFYLFFCCCSLPVFKIMNWSSSILQRWLIHILKVLLWIYRFKHIWCFLNHCSYKWFQPSDAMMVVDSLLEFNMTGLFRFISYTTHSGPGISCFSQRALVPTVGKPHWGLGCSLLMDWSLFLGLRLILIIVFRRHYHGFSG